MRLAQEIKQHAEARGITAGQFAVAWVLNSAFVSGVIAGPRTEEQWDDYIKAIDYRFTAEDEALIDRLVATGHPSTPGFNDPAYPIEGAGRGPRPSSNGWTGGCYFRSGMGCRLASSSSERCAS